MYCLKCQHITETENITTAVYKNSRLMRRGQCVACGQIKTQFIKKGTAGGSFLNSLVNKLPFEIHLPGHNFTGPGTKLNKKIELGWNTKE